MTTLLQGKSPSQDGLFLLLTLILLSDIKWSNVQPKNLHIVSTQTETSTQNEIIEGLLQTPLFGGLVEVTEADIEKAREIALKDSPEKAPVGELTAVETRLFAFTISLTDKYSDLMKGLPHSALHHIFGGPAISAETRVKIRECRELDEKREMVLNLFWHLVKTRFAQEARKDTFGGFTIGKDFKVFVLPPEEVRPEPRVLMFGLARLH